MIRCRTAFLYAMAPVLLALGCGHRRDAGEGRNAMRAFVDSLMGEMTLEEKVGQLNLLTSDMAVTGPTMRDSYLADVRAGRCGAILNAYTPAYVRKLQEVAVNETRLHIPLLFGFDVVHGHKTVFPVPLAMACSWDTSAIQRAARMAAEEAAADGLNWVYSPMVDLVRDPRWGRVVESAGEDPVLGAAIARAYVRGYQGSDLSSDSTVMACVKHFALYGAAEGGRDYNVVDMSRRRMMEDYLPPYRAAVDAGAGSVMTAFNEINGVPATANHWLLTKLLREDWHFGGFVVTDYNAVMELIAHGVAADKSAAAGMALQAGADMDMMGSAYIDALPQLVKSDSLPMATLDTAVRRVLEAKYRLGLFRDPYNRMDTSRARQRIMSPDKLAFARNMARRSMVLLRNEGGVLPLKKQGTIAVIGPLADDRRDMIGPWSGAGDWHQAVTILQGLREAAGDSARILYARGANITEDTALRRQLNRWGGALTPSTASSEALRREAVAVARRADVVVMCLGESQGMSGEAASRADIRLPACQRDLLEAVSATGKPVVLLLSNGRPLVLTWEDAHVPAILETWFLGTEAGHAVADILFGAAAPTGKLAMSFPNAVGQIPVYYSEKNTGRPRDPEVKYTSKYLDAPNAALYPFGYGLSYMTFSYHDLRLDHRVLSPDSTLDVSVTVRNDGHRDGEETVQLYIRDLVASVTRPLRQLRRWRKVFLQAGEEKTLHFTLGVEDLRFPDRQLRWVAEPGDVEVFVGGSSTDTLSARFTLTL